MSASSPLCLPVDEAERGVNKPAHLSQRPLVVNTDEEGRGRGVLEGRKHRLSTPGKQNAEASHPNEMRWAPGEEDFKCQKRRCKNKPIHGDSNELEMNTSIVLRDIEDFKRCHFENKHHPKVVSGFRKAKANRQRGKHYFNL